MTTGAYIALVTLAASFAMAGLGVMALIVAVACACYYLRIAHAI